MIREHSQIRKAIRLLSLAIFVTSVTISCGGGIGADAVVENFAIAYVKKPLSANNGDDIREALTFVAGGDLYLRDVASPSAKERNITESFTGGMGDVKDVEVSFDGKKILFAMRAPEIEGVDPEDQPTWNIWEYSLDNTHLRRIITSDISAEDGQDIAPHYLPDGRIVFSSTRQRQSKAILIDEGKPQFEALDERRRESALVIHVMNADGSDIHQISFNQSHDLDPVVLESGEILFSRWDNMGSRNQISLYKMRPDGLDQQIVYGAHSHATGTHGSQIQFIQPRVLPDGGLLSIIRPFNSTQLGGEIITIDIENFTDYDQPTWINQNVIIGNAQRPATINQVNTGSTPSVGGHFSSAYPLRDGTNRILVSWTPCRLTVQTVIMPCTTAALTNPANQEAPPLYGLYIYDRDNHTQLPITIGEEGVLVTDVVPVQARQLPNVLLDNRSGIELDATLVSEQVGLLHIRSVYDFDGNFNSLGAVNADVSSLADPAQATADDRPARFLRVVKAVSIPDRNTRQIPGTAYGRSSAQLMREIIGYAPIEPDGSVRVKVPANVPLAISILDKDGRRIGARHQNWIQVLPGETKQCHGCHTHSSGLAHAHQSRAPSINAGAPTTGLPFPNTESTLFADMGETMAETRTRLDSNALNLSVDIGYDDVWTDPAAAGRAKDSSFDYSYANLTTPMPVSNQCQITWTSICRIVINYESIIHPLWAKNRGAGTCTLCHGPVDAMNNPQVPAAQLDLTDGPSADEAAHFKSYRELFFDDNEQEVIMGTLQDRLVQATDINGNPLFEVDANGNQILDNNGFPIPVMVTVNVSPVMSVAGALSSPGFFDLFATGGTHQGRLDAIELKLLSEWVDIGAQYFNNPFDVPPP
ncbi:MAG: hypothetical protein ACE5EH_04230 [Gammaproteobacteria bacterium]